MKWQDMNRGAPGDDDYGPADTVAGFAVEERARAARPQSAVVLPHAALVFHLAEPSRAESARSSTGSAAGRALSRHRPQLGRGQRADRAQGRPARRAAQGGVSRSARARISRPRLPHRARNRSQGAARRQRIRCRTRRARARSPPHGPARSAAADAEGRDPGRRGRHPGASDCGRRPAVFAGGAAPVSRRHRRASA